MSDTYSVYTYVYMPWTNSACADVVPPFILPHRVRLILPHFRCSASSLVPSDSAPLALSSVTVGGASRSAEESVAEEEATMARKVDPRLTFSEQYRLAEDLAK